MNFNFFKKKAFQTLKPSAFILSAAMLTLSSCDKDAQIKNIKVAMPISELTSKELANALVGLTEKMNAIRNGEIVERTGQTYTLSQLNELVGYGITYEYINQSAVNNQTFNYTDTISITFGNQYVISETEATAVYTAALNKAVSQAGRVPHLLAI